MRVVFLICNVERMRYLKPPKIIKVDKTSKCVSDIKLNNLYILNIFSAAMKIY